MQLGFALVVVALGVALIYKGYTNKSWPDFYKTIFGK